MESPCLEGWVAPKNLEELQTYATKALDKDRFPGPKWVGAKLPAELMKKVLGTLRQFPHTETAYTLYYNATEGKWDVKCPEQSGQGASVSFEDDGTGMPVGYTLMGSIHTHPEMGAFWSGTDLHDQQFKAGLHIVFGLHDGLVTQHKCTVFMPNAQEDQNIWDVLEEVDFSQAYDPVPEWVEIIKKQSYHRVTTYKYYGGHTTGTGKVLPPGHYGGYNTAQAGYNYRYNGSGKRYADYSYGDYSEFDWDSYYKSYYGGAGYDYGDDIEDRTPAKAEVVTDTRAAIEKALQTNNGALELSEILLDPAIRGQLEQLLGIVIVDACDKTDIMMGMESLMTGETPLKDMDDEEARQIFEGLSDLHPDLKVIDSKNAISNDINADTLCVMLDYAVEAYGESKCISPDMVNTMLDTLRADYEKLLEYKAQHDNPQEETTEEAAEC